MAIEIGAFNPLALLVLAVPLFFLRRRGHGIGHLLCFSLFFLYLWAVFSYVIFPLRLDAEYIEMMRLHRAWAGQLNLVPLFFAPGFDVRSAQVYGNFLLGAPFGFGLPFISKLPARRVIQLGFGFSLGLELLQLVIGLIYGFPYRVIDVNDVLLVFAGVIFGHLTLRAAARGYQRLTPADTTTGPLGRHVHSVLAR